jgi:regulator of ribonuclease activity A
VNISTADLCDAHADELRIAEPQLVSLGGTRAFGGPIATVRVREDNVLVRQALEEPGQGRVLVVDGGGSLRCALLGDMLATLARDNGWAGVIVNGCVRDAEAIGTIAVGVLALATHPRKSAKLGHGARDVPVTFAGVTFEPGQVVYADLDGIVVATRPLLDPP